MLAAILAFINVIPGLGAVAQGITKAITDAKVNMLVARTGATRDVAVETIRAAALADHEHTVQMQVVTTGPLVWLIFGFGAIVMSYFGKCVVWDTMFDLGSTPALHGDVGTWMSTVINWLFGSTTTLAAGSMAIKAIKEMKS